MKEFAEQRLPSVSQQQQDRSSEVRFWDTMHKNNAPTIDNLYQVVKSSKEKNKTNILRADRKCPSTPYHCLCSLIIAKIWVDACTSRVSRDQWQSLSWAEIFLSRLNYKWNKLPKWNRASRQLRSIDRWPGISFCNWECSNVWGLCRELSSSSSSSWIALSTNPRHIWAVSRRFHQVRNERKTHKVHSPYPAIEDGSVPLPHSWPNFLALPDNKSDLARFLLEHIIVNTPPDKAVLAAGGFVDEREVQSSERAIDLSALKATHEEADTRLMVNCISSSLDNVVFFFFLYFIVSIYKLCNGQAKRHYNASFTILH